MFGGITLVLIVIFGVSLFSLSPYSPYATTTTTNASTFTIYSYQDGEDVSNFVELTIWVPKSDAEFDDIEDIYTMSNYEAEETSKDADDISLDLSTYSYVWIEVDPDGDTVFSNNFQLIIGGSNYDYSLYAYHLTSDVNFNALNRDTLDELTLGDYSTDANITIIMDCPHLTTSNIHANSEDWAVDEDDWDDMTASEQLDYWDEKYWRTQAPLYDPSADLEKEAENDLEKLTNAFAFKLDFNGTISTTDGEDTQINLTISDSGEKVEVVTTGDLIYLIYYGIVSFEDGPNALNLEITFGDDIHLDDIDSGRIEVPRDDDNLGTFTKYSDIGA